jgi:hypothetical protein
MGRVEHILALATLTSIQTTTPTKTRTPSSFVVDCKLTPSFSFYRHTMPLGLQYVPINQILDSFEELGINTIRFPFSNQMLHDTTPVQDAWVAANTQFRGMTPLQVYDGVIKALTDRGFAVIVNNHVTNSIWCCGVDGNERWNESQDINTWISDWLLVVNRYKDNKRVVGADLYNEVSRLKPITSISL